MLEGRKKKFTPGEDPNAGLATRWGLRRLLETRRRREMRDRLDATNARWATFKDVMPLVGERYLAPSPDGRIYLGEFSEPLPAGGTRVAHLFSEPEDNVMVIAPTGAGKTESIIETTILRHQGPVIATSSKTDLLDHTYRYRSSIGPVYIFAPDSVMPYPKDQWSPLQHVHSWNDAKRVSRTLIASSDATVQDKGDNKSYFNLHTNLLLPSLLYAASLAQEAGSILEVNKDSSGLVETRVNGTMFSVARWTMAAEIGGLRAPHGILEATAASAGGTLAVIDEVRKGRKDTEIQAESQRLLSDAQKKQRDAKQRFDALDPSDEAKNERDRIYADLLLSRDIISTVQGRERARKLLARGIDPRELDQMEQKAREVQENTTEANENLDIAFSLEGERRGGTFGTAMTAVTPYDDDAFKVATSVDQIDFDRIFDENGTLYIVAGDDGGKRPLYQSLISEAVSNVKKRKEAGKRLYPKAIFALDELAHIGRLPNLSKDVNTSQQHGYSFVTAVQTRAKLRSVYGKDEAESIEAGHRVVMTMGVDNDKDTLESVGNTRVTVNSTTEDGDGKRSRTRTVGHVPLITNAYLQSLRKGQAVILKSSEGVPPVKTQLRPASVLFNDLWGRWVRN